MEKQRSQHHRDNGHSGCHYTRIYGRGDGQTDGIAALVENDAEHSCEKEKQQVLWLHFLLRHESRGNPKAQRATNHAEAHHLQPWHTMRHGVLAEWCHQSPNGASQQHADMGNNRGTRQSLQSLDSQSLCQDYDQRRRGNAVRDQGIDV